MSRFVTTAAASGSSAYIVQRLRAHAQLCRQVAVASSSEQTAGEFARLAEDCIRQANELEPAARAVESPRPH